MAAFPKRQPPSDPAPMAAFPKRQPPDDDTTTSAMKGYRKGGLVKKAAATNRYAKKPSEEALDRQVGHGGRPESRYKGGVEDRPRARQETRGDQRSDPESRPQRSQAMTPTGEYAKDPPPPTCRQARSRRTARPRSKPTGNRRATATPAAGQSRSPPSTTKRSRRSSSRSPGWCREPARSSWRARTRSRRSRNIQFIAELQDIFRQVHKLNARWLADPGYEYVPPPAPVVTPGVEPAPPPGSSSTAGGQAPAPV